MRRDSRWCSVSLVLLLLLAGCTPVEQEDNVAAPVAAPTPADEPDPERAALDHILALESADPQDPVAQLEAVDAFLDEYPDAVFGSRVTAMRAGLRASAMLDPAGPEVLERAKRLIDAYLQEGRPGTRAYEFAANILFDSEAHLPTAIEYADRALAASTGAGARQTALQVVARARFAEGEVEEAIALLREAIEISPSFTGHSRLGEFLAATGDREQARSHLARAILLYPDAVRSPSPSQSVAPVDGLRQLAAAETDSARAADAYVADAIGSVADAMLAEADDVGEVKATMAQAFALIGVHEERALLYAREEVDANGPESGIEAYVGARVAYAQVLESMGRYEAALEALAPLEQLAGAFDPSYPTTLVRTLTALGREQEAIEVYLQRLRTDEPLRPLIEPLWQKHRPDEDIDSVTRAAELGLESWQPAGIYDVPDGWQGKVVLAELFTGAQCVPCQAADIAYDGLIAYYPREVLAVLENHVHIPAPDPMVNQNAVDRTDYYGDIVTGAPRSIIDGDDAIRGGGPAAWGKARYAMYRWSIERKLLGAPLVDIELDAARSGQTVNVSVGVSPRPELSDFHDLRLRIALAEDLVTYEGANGIGEHGMVTRAFVGGIDGFALGADGTVRVDEEIDIAELEASIEAYLVDFEENPPDRFRNFERFDEKKHEIIDDALVVVAFVQNDATREVLQARVLELN